MTDPGNVVLALAATIWARENTRSAGFERLNRIRDRIAMGGEEGDGVAAHRRHIYRADWVPMAVGMVAVNCLFAAIVGVIPFLFDAPRNPWLVGLCGGAFLYLVCSAVATAMTFRADAKYLREKLGPESAGSPRKPQPQTLPDR